MLISNYFHVSFFIFSLSLPVSRGSLSTAFTPDKDYFEATLWHLDFQKGPDTFPCCTLEQHRQLRR